MKNRPDTTNKNASCGGEKKGKQNDEKNSDQKRH
jgi:hypothetical protein